MAVAQKEISISYPQPGWVEQDALEIWQTQRQVAREAFAASGLQAQDLRCLGIANQRETIIIWDALTGQPLCPAIVWQCRRSTPLCEALKRDTRWVEEMRARTGLALDPYFSGTKIAWLMEHQVNLRSRMEKGEILVGTVDSWLIWNMTEDHRHVTDTTNASRTMLFNIKSLDWDDYLMERLKIPRGVLPQALHSTSWFGNAGAGFLGCPVPITGVMGDQQAALLGHGCTEPGMIKNTYGTGCFLLANTGNQACFSRHGLLTTVAWSSDEATCYALEGSVFTVGSVVQWLKQMGFIETSDQSGPAAMSVPDTNGVMFVPAFSGLGSPYWDPQARGMVMGLTGGTKQAHIVRAALEAIAYQNAVLLEAVAADAGFEPKVMLVDGGVARNDFLMGFQADILNIPVERPPSPEVTAWGAACAAAVGSGLLESMADIPAQQAPRVFEPKMEEAMRDRLLKKWKDAVDCARSWK